MYMSGIICFRYYYVICGVFISEEKVRFLCLHLHNLIIIIILSCLKTSNTLKFWQANCVPYVSNSQYILSITYIKYKLRIICWSISHLEIKRICVFHVIIIKSEICFISHCAGLCYKAMICFVCLTMFVCTVFVVDLFSRYTSYATIINQIKQMKRIHQNKSMIW